MPSARTARRAGAIALLGAIALGGALAPAAPAATIPVAADAGSASAASSAARAAAAQPDSRPEVAFKINDPRISESSGLAVSRRHRGVVYTHNDSGGRPQVYAIGSDGRVRATLTLGGATMRDWEGIAAGRDDAGRPALFVADIGDNLGGAWPSVTVYRISEPARLRSGTVRATAFRLKYADGARDAESVLIHPKTNRLYVASKLVDGRLYAAPRRLRAGRTNVLRPVGRAPGIATDGAYAPDGSSFAIRTYFAVEIYRAPGKLIESLSLPRQEQGESISYTADGKALFAGSEFTGQPVWRVPLPDKALPEPATDQKGAAGQPGSDPGGGTGPAGKTLAFLLMAVLAVGAVVAVARRRSR